MRVDGEPTGWIWTIGEQRVYSRLLEGQSYEAYVYPSGRGWQVLLHGALLPGMVEDEREKRRLRAQPTLQERVEFT